MNVKKRLDQDIAVKRRYFDANTGREKDAMKAEASHRVGDA